MNGAATPETTALDLEQGSEDRTSRRPKPDEGEPDNIDTSVGKSGRSRLTLEFSSDATERLRDIRERIGSPSNADVIRKSLLVLDWILKLEAEKKRFQVKDLDDGTTTQVKFFL